jgi:uncharacterized protein (DUF4213/DUF364 family)
MPGSLAKVALKQGWNVVIGTGGQCGMAMSFTGWDGVFGEPRLDLGALGDSIGKNLFDVALERLDSESWQERSISVAAISALSQPFLTPSSLEARGFEVPADNPDFASSLRNGDIAAIVGYGGGVVRALGRCRELHVLDMRPPESLCTTLITANGIELAPSGAIVHPAGDNEEVLAKATAVSITGSTFVNGTFDDLIHVSRNARLITVYGASAGFIPDVMFEHGVHMVHSSLISDPGAFEYGVLRELNMEQVMRQTQMQQTVVAGVRR